MSNKNSSTRAFDPVGNGGGSPKGKKQKLLVAIFAVIILILALMAALIGAEILRRLPQEGTTTTKPPVSDGNSIYLNRADVKLGGLLLITEDSPYSIEDADLEKIENVKTYQSRSEHSALTEINGKYTYSLSSNKIYLSETALGAFNKMVLDYCKTLDTANASDTSASNLEIAWAGYDASIVYDSKDGYEADLANYGQIMADHILGNSLTLKRYDDGHQTFISEEILKKDFGWIYEHAHEYGFVIRYPNACSEHTHFDSKDRVRLRYVGVEHATYMYEQGICLDEYVERLKAEYTYQSPLTVSASGRTYLVYYVEYVGDPTTVPIPKNTDPENYTVSGDNIGGFIVTVKQ